MRLVITRPGSLLSVVLEREVTEQQAAMITNVLDSDVKPGRLAWLLDGDNSEEDEEDYDLDAPFGAGDAVEAYRG